MPRRVRSWLRPRELTYGDGKWISTDEAWRKTSDEDQKKFRQAWPWLAAVIERRRAP